MVGGVNADLPFEYYLDLIGTIKRIYPQAAIKAFTAVEIDHFAHISGQSLENTILALKGVGLDMMPGGGAEIFVKHHHVSPVRIVGQGACPGIRRQGVGRVSVVFNFLGG